MVRNSFWVALAIVSLCAVPAHATAIFVAGPGPVAPFSGTLIDFEGIADGTLVPSLGGVSFSQDDGGTPEIDNSPFLFAYDSSSGTGVLTGSSSAGSVETTAGIVATFATPQTRVGAFMSDTVALGDYSVTAFGLGGVVLESLIVHQGDFPTAPTNEFCVPFPPWVPSGNRCGVFVGFDRAEGDILSVQFGPSGASRGSDALAIDDLIFSDGTAAPEPVTAMLMVIGLVGLGVSRRKHQ
jgi:hypothetical protein